nr:hypothetical protein [Tanacetum cinerariifolium]
MVSGELCGEKYTTPSSLHKKGTRASREESILQKIPKGPGEVLGVQDYEDTYGDSLDSPSWTNAEKTVDDDYDIGDDQTGSYEIKASVDYVNYLTKCGNTQPSMPIKGRGRGKCYMNRGGMKINSKTVDGAYSTGGLVNNANVDYAELIWKEFRYGKTILDVMLIEEIKASVDYVNYLTKCGNTQPSVPIKGRGRGKCYMNRGGMKINVSKKRKT